MDSDLARFVPQISPRESPYMGRRPPHVAGYRMVKDTFKGNDQEASTCYPHVRPV
jgi:hypothetical protein